MLQVSPQLTLAKSVWRRIGVRGHWAIVALLVLAAGAGVVWWATHSAAPMHYVTVPVEHGVILRTATATGTVNPVLTIIVGAYDFGVIQNIYCDYNTEVRAGQVCAKIDPRPYQATFDQYSGQLRRDQAILDEARIDLARYQKLAEQNSIARQQAEDQAYVVNQDEGTVKLDQAYVEGAKLNLDYTDIVSPVDGTVVSRSITGGQTVASSFQTPTLFLIASDLNKMEVDTNTSESRYRRRQGRRHRHLYRRRLSAAGVPWHRDATASVAADGAERRDLRRRHRRR